MFAAHAPCGARRVRPPQSTVRLEASRSPAAVCRAGIRQALALLVAAVAGSEFASAQESASPFSRRPQGVDARPEPRTLFEWTGSQPADEPDQTQPIATDRPDFTEASSTVGLGVLQIESGYTYGLDRSDQGNTINHSYPEALFRYGVWADWLELRVAWNNAHLREAGVETGGAEDLYLGFKVGLVPQDGCRPEMALVGQMTAPTGAEAFTAGEVLPGVNWLYGWDINDFLAAGGSTQFNRALDDTGEAYTEWAQSWTVGCGWTERLGSYTEWFGLFPHSAASARPEHYFNGGFTYLLSLDVQWDIRAGVGLNDAAEDYFLGTGISLRYR